MNIRLNITRIYKSLFQKALLVFIVISFITGYRFSLFDKLFYFDILILIYIFIFFLFKRSFSISKFTVDSIKLLFIIFLPTILLINFTNNIVDSLYFMSQYLFIITILPLFMESVYRTKQFDFFLKILLFLLFLNSLLFLFVFLGIVEKLYFSDLFAYRFALGELTPNEMGHYLVLMLFLTTILVSNKYKILIEAIGIIPYILTFSKTVWVQLVLFMLMKRFKIIVIISSILIISMYFSNYYEVIFKNIKYIYSDFSIDTKSNQIRVNMFLFAIENIQNTIFYPAYHSIHNIDNKYESALSVHNGIASYITNFGLISFLFSFIVVIPLIANNIKDKYFRFILLFILLDFITLMFNPIINSRIVWFPLYLYIAAFHFRKIKYE